MIDDRDWTASNLQNNVSAQFVSSTMFIGLSLCYFYHTNAG